MVPHDPKKREPDRRTLWVSATSLMVNVAGFILDLVCK